MLMFHESDRRGVRSRGAGFHSLLNPPWRTGVGRRVTGAPRRAAFTLFEMMLAISVLALIFTAVVVSFHGKWRAEETRRGAQKLVLAWLKTRSLAWREGREWTMVWDGEHSKIHAAPVDSAAVSGTQDGVSTDEGSLRSFSVNLGSGIGLVSEKDQQALPTIRFFSNGRVRHVSLLVVGNKGDAWRVRSEWDGRPILEKAADDLPRKAGDGLGKSHLPSIQRDAVIP